MKWERYSKMTPEHKEEWNYRFKDKTELTMMTPVLYGLGFVIIMSLILVLSFELSKCLSPDYNVELDFVLYSILGLVRIFSWSAIFLFIVDLTNLIYYVFKENKWLKERGY